MNTVWLTVYECCTRNAHNVSITISVIKMVTCVTINS